MDNLIHTRNPTPRIGLFGGTFNPIHQGHVLAAKDVLQQFGLDRIYFIPSAQPPHKTQGTLASAQDRIEMVRFAIADQTAFSVSSIEIDRSGPSYTIDTLREFETIHHQSAELQFIVGIDAFLEIHSWKSYRRMFDLTSFILMTRPALDGKSRSLTPLAFDYTRHHISDEYTLAPEGDALVHAEKKTIYLATVKPIAIASTQIRDMVRRGEPIRRWVTPAVSDYIDSKGLYR